MRGGRPDSDCLSSKKMSKSRRFQPYPSTNKDKTRNPVDCGQVCRKQRRKRVVSCERQREGHASFVSSLISIGYYWL
jgi:hypothetical protein